MHDAHIRTALCAHKFDDPENLRKMIGFAEDSNGRLCKADASIKKARPEGRAFPPER
jgi:hypothetical protein